MKRLFNALAIVFLVSGLAFTILPLGAVAFIPIGLALVFAAVALFVTKTENKKTSEALLIIGAFLGLTVIVKDVVIEQRLAFKTEEELKMWEQMEENLRELEELENHLDKLDETYELDDL